jgi:hypothetical protein
MWLMPYCSRWRSSVIGHVDSALGVHGNTGWKDRGLQGESAIAGESRLMIPGYCVNDPIRPAKVGSIS